MHGYAKINFWFQTTNFPIIIVNFSLYYFLIHHRTEYFTVTYRAARLLPCAVYDNDIDYEIRWWNLNGNT